MNHSLMKFDVIIIGAGMVGSALACALGSSDIRVAIIEAQQIKTDWPDHADHIDGYDPRISALTTASQNFLQDIGVWSSVSQQRISAYNHMHVWDAEGTGSIDFNAEEINQAALGHIVENRVTATALLRGIEQHNNLQILSPAKLSTLELHNTGSADSFYHLSLECGRELQAPLVVAADGANSYTRRLAEFEMREWDYDHHAIVATVETERDHQQTAWQRFLPEGPLAFLPLATSASDDKYFCSIVWSAIPSYSENLMALDDDAFSLALANAFENKLGAIKAVSPRFSFPLRQRHAVDYVKPSLALVGDAAHTIHPLAGQGVNLGLMDVKALSEELLRAQQRQLELGSLAVLERYQRRRKAANLSMMVGMEGFKRLFEQPYLPVRWARNAGMRWLDGAAPLKHRLMRGAMGL
jgi:2-octaprenylphenol hydroxylase